MTNINPEHFAYPRHVPLIQEAKPWRLDQDSVYLDNIHEHNLIAEIMAIPPNDIAVNGIKINLKASKEGKTTE